MASQNEDAVGVVARFSVKAESVEAFKEFAQAKRVEPTRGEPGCISYELWQDLADPTLFAMVEQWENESALNTHLAQESLQVALESLRPMASGAIEMQRFRPLG
jgi:quinol monooxygenase YgiN